MKFEYHSFEVEPYLQKGVRPGFLLKDLNQGAIYYTVSDMEPVEFSVNKGGNGSEGTNLKIFPIASSNRSDHDDAEQLLSHGSILFALGLETAMKILEEFKIDKPITKVIVALATNCHELEGGRYRAYFGMSIEVDK